MIRAAAVLIAALLLFGSDVAVPEPARSGEPPAPAEEPAHSLGRRAR